jgi:putative ABC transport system permease protein
MWLLTLRDLQWRRRRFVIAVLATAIALAMSLLMAWINARLHHEPRRILKVIAADAWVVNEATSGPFTASKVVPASLAQQVARLPGVVSARPMVLLHSTMQARSTKDVNVIGTPVGAPGWPKLTKGRLPQAPGETAADTAAGVGLDRDVTLAGRRVRVVGLAEGISYYFAAPTFFVPLEDAQAIAFNGQPLAMAVATEGVPQSAPPGFQVLSPAQVETDLNRILAGSTQTIAVLDVLLLLMAAGIIGSIVYLSALERQREFAVLKATGAANRSLLAGLALQAVVLSAAAAVLAAGIARLLAPVFPFTVEIPPPAFPRLVVVAMVVGLAASFAGLRRAVSVQPALAFGGP